MAVKQYKTVSGLFRDAERWTKHAVARRFHHGRGAIEVQVDDPKASCFCLGGAIYRVYPSVAANDRAGLKVVRAIKKLFPKFATRNNKTFDLGLITLFNDGSHRTIEDIRRVVKEARI